MEPETELDRALDAELAASGGGAPTTPTVPANPNPSPSDPSLAAAPPTTPAPASAASNTPPPAVPGATPPVAAGAAPAGTPAAAPSPAAAGTFTGARDFAARAVGFQGATQYNDDASFIEALVRGTQAAQQQMAQMQQMAQFGQMYLQERAQQQRQPAAPAADPLAAFKAPEFNPAWLAQIKKDPETGALSVIPGADPTILPKYLAYQQHRAELSEKFLSNPVDFLKPILEQAVAQHAGQLVQTTMQQQQTTQQVEAILQQNASWIWQRDSVGNAVTNPITGRPIMSAAGQRYQQYIAQLERSGVTDPVAQNEWALRSVNADIYQAALAQQQIPANNDAAKQRLVAQMSHAPAPDGSLMGPANNGNPAAPPQNTNLSLKERLLNALKAEGFSENTPLIGGE